jgi:hypothetical protein
MPRIRPSLLLAFAAAVPLVAAAAPVPPPIPPVQQVVDLGIVKQNPFVQCRDGTYSARVGNRAVWTFNDTCLTNGGVLGDTFIDNSLAWTTTFDASGGLKLGHDLADADGVPTRFVPLTNWELSINAAHAPNEIAIWPGHLVDDPKRQRELIFYGAVYRGPKIGFHSAGAGIAVATPDFQMVTRPPESLDPNAPEPNYMWARDEQSYTGGYVVVGDMLYCYGGEGKGLRTLVHVARVPLADALDKRQWTYWDGHTWNTDPAASRWVYEGGAAGDTIFYDAYLGVFVTVYMPYASNDVYFRVADKPQGPWSEPSKIFTAEQGTDTSYAARVHTEYAQNGGQVQYITYVKNTGFLSQELPLVQVTFGPMPPR